MYSTPKDVHIAIELGLQQVNTNRKQSFLPEHFDMLVNDVLMEYVDSEVNQKGDVANGFEDSVNRYDSLRELKRESILKCYYDNDERYYSVLPVDYYKLIPGSCRVGMYFNNKVLPTTTSTETKYVYSLEVLTAADIAVLNSRPIWFYFDIDGGVAKEYDNKPILSTNGQFQYINYFLDIAKERNQEVYWERYGNTYVRNNFIIVSSLSDLATSENCMLLVEEVIEVLENPNTEEIEAVAPLDPIQKDPVLLYSETRVYNTANSNYKKIARLISSKDKFNIENHYTSNNSHLSPLLEMSNNKIYTYKNNKFIPLTLDITYLKLPRKMNYYFNVMPDITIDYLIVTKVIDKIKVLIKDEQAYTMFVNKVNQLQ